MNELITILITIALILLFTCTVKIIEIRAKVKQLEEYIDSEIDSRNKQ